MKTLRLIFTEKCHRSCEYCCNKQYDMSLYHSWKWSKVNKYSAINISGGEPMLYPDKLKAWIRRFRALRNTYDWGPSELFLYTAYTKSRNKLFNILDLIDGLTVTLHDQSDVASFERFNMELEHNGPYGKSLRLSVFGDVTLSDAPYPLWNIMRNRQALKVCPVPEDDMLILRDNFER